MRIAFLTSLTVASCLCVPGMSGGQEPSDGRGLDIYFVDVMGGAATLIVTPEKESILIDSGWPGFNDRDPERVVHALKDLAGCDHLDHLVTTHWHVDHFGGVEGLAKRVEIRNYWDRGMPEDKLAGIDFPDGPRDEDPLVIAYRKASAGKRKPLLPGASLPVKGLESLVLASGTKLLDDASAPMNPDACADSPPDRAVDNSDNGRSLVLRFRYHAFDFLDAGDLTWNIEKSLVCPKDLIGPVDLYQVTHHGMDISNHPALIRTIRPTAAVMNNGPKKGGSAATFRLLRSIPSIEAIFALHKNQNTPWEDNADKELTANTDPAGGQFVHARVSPDGSSYTLRIGEKGTPHVMESRADRAGRP